MLKKIIIIIVTIIIITLLALWAAGEYFFDILFKKDDDISKQISDVNQQENISYRNVDFLKAQKWWDSIETQELNIISDDGLNLTGYLLKNVDNSDKLVILAHGRLGDSKTMVLFAQYYYQNGYNVLIPDERSCGKSQGNILGMGYFDSKDYELWINKMIEKFEDTDIKIILHGVSTGATAFLLLCDNELPNVKCIISDSAYSSLKEFVDYRLKYGNNLPEFPISNVVNIICKSKQGYSFKDVDACKHVQSSKVPILFIHSNQDAYIPEYMAYKLYESANCQKDLWIVEGNNHGTSFFTNTEEYKTKIKEFSDRTLGM